MVQASSHEPFSFLLNVVSRTRIIAEIDDARKTIQTVSDGDVQRLAKDAIALARVSDDLSVPARNVQHYGIPCAGDFSTHLDI